MFGELQKYCGIDNLPEGLENLYKEFPLISGKNLISQSFFNSIISKYKLFGDRIDSLKNAIKAVENDEKLFKFTKFIILDMCSSRNRCDIDNYTNMTPNCMKAYGEYYSLILLLSCIEPSMNLLKERGVPSKYYKDIPYRVMDIQMDKYNKTGDITVSDFSWDMNFYTCSIFLFDRFLFIPYKFNDSFNMYRNVKTKDVVGIYHAGTKFRRDGQIDGINKISDTKSFTTEWIEDENNIIGNPISPLGYVKQDKITIDKNLWKMVLGYGDILLAWHIPAGPGYTTEKLKNSMTLALEFYSKYFNELPIKGFWSESWLYDNKLALILDKNSNIVKMLRQFFVYPINEGDGKLRYEVFGGYNAEPENVELKTSLQKKAAEYMSRGGRFNTSSMILLSREVDKIGQNPYITEEQLIQFEQTVDSHLEV